jgi:hypothetical protein
VILLWSIHHVDLCWNTHISHLLYSSKDHYLHRHRSVLRGTFYGQLWKSSYLNLEYAKNGVWYCLLGLSHLHYTQGLQKRMLLLLSQGLYHFWNEPNSRLMLIQLLKVGWDQISFYKISNATNLWLSMAGLQPCGNLFPCTKYALKQYPFHTSPVSPVTNNLY